MVVQTVWARARQFLCDVRRPLSQRFFIHIPKNGGTSIRRFLPVRISHGGHHYRYRDIEPTLPDGVRCFAVVRNPWSRTVSRYHYAIQYAPTWPESDYRRKYFEGLSFERFVTEHLTLEIPQWPGQPWMGPHGCWLDQLEWLIDDAGEIACDCLRLECLDEDLRFYLGKTVPRLNSTARSEDYRAMYTDDLAERVGMIHARDIEHFGFTFDGPATRGTVYAD